MTDPEGGDDGAEDLAALAELAAERARERQALQPKALATVADALAARTADATTAAAAPTRSPRVWLSRAGWCLQCQTPLEAGRATCDACIALARHERDRAALALAKAQVPAAHRDASFRALRLELGAERARVSDSKTLEAVFSVAKAWVSGEYDPLVVVLWGNTGCGKSTLAAAVALATIRSALPTPDFSPPAAVVAMARGFRWVEAVDLGEARREDKLGQVPKLIAQARSAPLLVLDELGRENDPDVIYRILQARMGLTGSDPARPTLITTAKTPTELRAHYDAGVWRRIQDPNFALILQVHGGMAPPDRSRRLP